MSNRQDRDAILSRRARLVALSLAGVGFSLQGATPGIVQAAPTSASASASSAAAPSWKDAPPEAREEALRLYSYAEDEMHNGSQERAIEVLLHAARVYPHPKVLAALAAAWEHVGRPDRALPVYSQILADPDTPPAIQKDIAASADKARSRVGRLRLEVSGGTLLELAMDGAPLSPDTTLILPGKHQIEARFEGRQKSVKRSFEARAGELASIALAPEPDTAPTVCLSPPPPPPPPPVRGGGCGCGTPGAP